MLKKSTTQAKGQCYCGATIKFFVESEFVRCSKCDANTFFHRKCVNMVDCEDDANWSCATCTNEPDLLIERLKSFYTQYQSNYCDFSGASNFMKFLERTTKYSKRLRNSHDVPVVIPIHNDSEHATKTKTWMTRGLSFNVDYAKALMLQMNCIVEIPDLFRALINILLCLSSSSKKAIARGKALKAICKIIRLKPENLMEDGIQKIIKLRVDDSNTYTRESALDLLYQFFSKSNSTEN